MCFITGFAPKKTRGTPNFHEDFFVQRQYAAVYVVQTFDRSLPVLKANLDSRDIADEFRIVRIFPD